MRRYIVKFVSVDGLTRFEERSSESRPSDYLYRVRGGLYAVWNERGRCWQEVEPGDWIIHGISGCRYPCKAEIFPQIYERVPDHCFHTGERCRGETCHLDH